jgi:apolipoprotein N-acyltransferase
VNHSSLSYGAAALSGLLITLSMPPQAFFFLGWAALTPLILASIRGRAGSAFLKGLAGGLAFHISALYWIPRVIRNYSNLPLAANLPLFLLLALYLSLFFGLFSLFLNRCGGYPAWRLLLAAPVFWTALEYLKTHLLTGFPWCLLGYSQAHHPEMIQMSAFSGVYGVSFLLVLSSTLLALAWLHRERAGRAFFFLAADAMLIAAVFLTGACLMPAPAEGEEEGGFVVACLQGNLTQEMKAMDGARERIGEIYRRMSLVAADKGADLIIWPESTIPTYFGYNLDLHLQHAMNSICRDSGRDILFGSVDVIQAEGATRAYNSAFLIHPSGRSPQKYDKRHLVPWGEYVPMKSLFTFLDRIVRGISDFSKGSGEQKSLVSETALGEGGRRIPFCVGICYEIIFPDLIRGMVDGGAEFITTLTNDAWFGRTSAPHQHFGMAVFRAVENRRYVVRCATTGISGLIDPFGRVMLKSALYERETLMDRIWPEREKTFYTRYGDFFSRLMIFLSFFLLILIYLKAKHPPKPNTGQWKKNNRGDDHAR